MFFPMKQESYNPLFPTGSFSSAPADLSSFKTGSLIAILGIHPHDPVILKVILTQILPVGRQSLLSAASKAQISAFISNVEIKTFQYQFCFQGCFCGIYKLQSCHPNSPPRMAKLHGINCLRGNKGSFRQLGTKNTSLGWSWVLCTCNSRVLQKRKGETPKHPVRG